MAASLNLSIELNDGTSMPWLSWGYGPKYALEIGEKALKAGIRHIDTAQIYETEEETGQVVAAAASFTSGPLTKDQIYVTSKLSSLPNDEPVPLDQVRDKVEESVKKLGFIPDLFLVHNPFVAPPGQLKALWKIFEELKSEGKLKSIGVSNFRVQDLETILDGAKYKPAANQLEYHPYTLAHLQPLLELQAKHNIVTQSYGPLTPILRHPTHGGPLKRILDSICDRLTILTGKHIDHATVLLLWIRAQGVVAVTSSGNVARLKMLGHISEMPDLLDPSEIAEITRVGKTVHFRHYTEHMEKDSPLPNLPNGA